MYQPPQLTFCHPAILQFLIAATCILVVTDYRELKLA